MPDHSRQVLPKQDSTTSQGYFGWLLIIGRLPIARTEFVAKKPTTHKPDGDLLSWKTIVSVILPANSLWYHPEFVLAHHFSLLEEEIFR